MSTSDDHDPNLHDGFVGISREKLEAMAESELAQWQHNHRNELPLAILAEREWERRIISHQLKEQYGLDARLSKAAEEHATKIAEATRQHAESLSNSNHRWGLLVAGIGVLGTLLGTVLGKYLEAKDNHQSTTQSAPAQISSPAASQSDPSTTATSAGSSPSSQSIKKTH